jgi:1,2-diacylglycerol 3-alpha-glucosyltransferase
MNILITSLTYKPHFGGVENSIYYLAKTLKKNHIVSIMVGDSGLGKGNRLPYYEKIDDIDVYRYKRLSTKRMILKPFKYFYDIYSSYMLAKKLNKKIVYDIAIHRSAFTGIGARTGLGSIKNIYIIPSISKVLDNQELLNDSVILFFKSLIKRYYFSSISNYAEEYFARKVDKVIVFSKNMLRQVQNNFNVKAKFITVLNPGVDSILFSPSKDKKSLRASFNYKSNQTIFLIVARLVKAKNIDFIIRIFEKLDGYNIKLIIVGEGPEKKHLVKLVDKLQLTEKIEFKNYTTNPIKYYQSSDVFIMSSNYEAFGFTILEAMSVGLPILAFKNDSTKIITANNEIIEHEKNGFLCNYIIEDFLDYMVKMCNFKKRDYENIQKNNHSKVIKNYSWKKFSNKLIDIATL